MSIRALHHRADGRDESVDLAAWRPRRIPRDQLLWIDLTDATADELAVVREAVELSEASAAALEAPAEAPDAVVLEVRSPWWSPRPGPSSTAIRSA